MVKSSFHANSVTLFMIFTVYSLTLSNLALLDNGYARLMTACRNAKNSAKTIARPLAYTRIKLAASLKCSLQILLSHWHNSHLKYFHHLIAEVIDDFDGDAAGRGFRERTRDGAVQG